MTDVVHHAIIVTAAGYVEPPDLDAFRARMPAPYRHLVVGPIDAVVNGYWTVAFLPEGSKEGWSEADDAARFRAGFRDLFSFTYDDGSSPYAISEVVVGAPKPPEGLQQPAHVDGWFRPPRLTYRAHGLIQLGHLDPFQCVGAEFWVSRAGWLHVMVERVDGSKVEVSLVGLQQLPGWLAELVADARCRLPEARRG